jgi:glutamine synthetase
MRIESRVGDGSMSLHLGATALLEAARLGVVDQLEAPPAYTGDGFEDGGGAARSATDLATALDHLEKDAAFTAAFEPELIGNFVANKRHEVERFEATGDSAVGESLSTFERTHYLPYH